LYCTIVKWYQYFTLIEPQWSPQPNFTSDKTGHPVFRSRQTMLMNTAGITNKGLSISMDSYECSDNGSGGNYSTYGYINAHMMSLQAISIYCMMFITCLVSRFLTLSFLYVFWQHDFEQYDKIGWEKNRRERSI